MSGVIVEFPIEEAEGILAKLIHTADPAAESGRKRLEQAVAVERGASGNSEKPPTVVEVAETLIGRNVQILNSYGGKKRGKLTRITESKMLVLETGPTSHQPISLALVASICADEDLEEAA